MAPGGRRIMIPDAELLRLVMDHDERVVSAKDIAEQVGVTPTTANNHLNRLETEGLLVRKDVGSGTVWWVPDRVTPETLDG